MKIEEIIREHLDSNWYGKDSTGYTDVAEAMRAALTELAAEHDRKQALLLEAHCERVSSLQERIRELEHELQNKQFEAQRVPEGWKLVPIEATQEMLKESGLYDDDTIEVNSAASMAGQIYRAMLAAAPKKEAE